MPVPTIAEMGKENKDISGTCKNRKFVSYLAFLREFLGEMLPQDEDINSERPSGVLEICQERAGQKHCETHRELAGRKESSMNMIISKLSSGESATLKNKEV